MNYNNYNNKQTDKTYISFNIHSLRVLDNTFKNQPQFKYHILLVNTKDLSRELSDWREINPRVPNLNYSVSKDIKDTLENKPSVFHLRNRGLTIIAERLVYDKSSDTNKVTLTFSDKDLHGILDGGHTFEVIQEYNKNQPFSDGDSFVKIEILTGLDSDESIDEIVEIVGGRNRSTQVPNYALQNLEGKFNEIEESLRAEIYFDKISFKPNEVDEHNCKKDISILEILRYVHCFDILNFPDENSAPMEAYSSISKIAEKYYNKKYCENIKKLAPLIPDILKLRDRIISEIPKRWKSKGDHRVGFGNLSDAGKKSPKPKKLPFSPYGTSYNVSKPYFLPILASFRDLITFNPKTEKYDWKYPFDEVFDEVFPKLVNCLKEKRTITGNINQLGKDKSLWTGCWRSEERRVGKEC